MSTGKATWLVARREIVERTGQRSFQVSTGLTLLIIAAAVIVPSLLDLGGDRTIKVTATGGTPTEIAEAAKQGAPALDVKLAVTRVNTEAEARQRVDDGEAEVAVVGEPARLVVQDELDPDAGALLQQAAAQLTRARTVQGLGIEPSARDELLQPPPLETQAIDPQEGDGEAEGLASIAVILLYGQLLMYGYWISAGVVEEKASRIVEVLLSTISATALLRGKLLGLGILGFVQLLVVGAVGTGLAIATDVLDVPSGAAKTFAAVLAFFVLGYAFYAALYAVAGATVQRQEDLQGSTMPLTVLVLVGFFIGIQAVGNPDGGLAQVASYLPPTMPMILPVRLIAGDVAVWEVVVAVGISLLASALLLAAAVRIYRNAILRTGGKVRILDAWRAG
ncbi:MAG TPA: ABC transporter permease [Solirubrobacteraceae bacterium]|nr:ABC transporter permease [Solirubrobacteraceae bacterium]